MIRVMFVCHGSSTGYIPKMRIGTPYFGVM